MMKGKDIKKSPSPTQIRIILFLIEHKHEIISQKDIENHLKLSRATVSDKYGEIDEVMIYLSILVY